MRGPCSVAWPASPRLARLVLSAALLAWPGVFLHAQVAAPSAQPAVAADATGPVAKPPVPLLWKASRGGRSVYLLGSFHLLRPGDYPLSADVDAAFADAESLLFEMAPAEMQSPTLALRMAQAGLRTDGSSLDSGLPPATAARLREWLAANATRLQGTGITAEALQRFEPWFVGLTIGILGMVDAGLDPALGIDRHFAAAALAAARPVDGFETGDQQIAIFAGMDPDEQLQFLDEALEQAQPGNDEIEQLHAAWRNGDVATIRERMAADMQRDYPGLYRRVNVERNDAWLPVIEARLHGDGDDDTLVVVGALHLLGSDGLVEKLAARGYGVERICSACAAP